MIDGRNYALGCVCDISLLNLEFAVFVVQSFDSLAHLAPGLTRKVCQTVLFHHDLVRKEQCTGVCTKITPVLLLTLYLVRIHAAYLIINRLLFLCGEGSSTFLEKSLSVVWLTRNVISVLLFAVSSATASFVGAMCELSVAC